MQRLNEISLANQLVPGSFPAQWPVGQWGKGPPFPPPVLNNFVDAVSSPGYGAQWFASKSNNGKGAQQPNHPKGGKEFGPAGSKPQHQLQKGSEKANGAKSKDGKGKGQQSSIGSCYVWDGTQKQVLFGLIHL